MGFKDHMRVPARSSPDTTQQSTFPSSDGKPGMGIDKRGRALQKQHDEAAAAVAQDPVLYGRQPKRSSSFGRGLGGGLQSLASGMSRASESLSRKANGGSDGNRTPPIANSHSSTPAMGPPPMPDSSHLAQFSLKLSELVNRAFMPCVSGAAAAPTSIGSGTSLAGAAKSAAAKTTGAGGPPPIVALSAISYDGKKLPSKAIISEIAMIVVAELEYAASVDPYLLRAVSRQALKALSLFADRVESLVISATRDPLALSIPATAKDGTQPAAALEFNLGLVTLEWIVEDALERCIEGTPGSDDEGMPHFVSEILTPVRKKMEATILHVILPLLTGVKASLTSTLAKSVLSPFAGHGLNLTPMSSAGQGASAGSGVVSPLGPLSPPVAQTANAVCLKELEGKVEGVRRLLVPRLVERTGQDGEGWFISVVIHCIWKGLFILTSRSLPVPTALAQKYPAVVQPQSALHLFAAEVNKRAPSPAQLTSALKSVSVVGRTRKLTDGALSTPSGAMTPSTASTPAGAVVDGGVRSTAMHPSGAKVSMLLTSDLLAFERLMTKFAAGFVSQSNKKSNAVSALDDSSDSDSDDDDEDELARAALAEALQAIRSCIHVAQHLDIHPDAVLDAAKRVRGRTIPSSSINTTLPAEVVHASKAIPPLLLLHLVYARMPTNLGVFAVQSRAGTSSSDPIVPSPPGAFNYSWADYERAIGGFLGGQTWSSALAQAWRQDIEEAWIDLRARMQAAEEMRKKKPINVDVPSANIGQRGDVSDELKASPLKMDGSAPAAAKPSIDVPPQDADVPEVVLDNTPTPDSVLLRNRGRISPATSAGASSESAPEHMTRSAPTLLAEQERYEQDSTQPHIVIVEPGTTKEALASANTTATNTAKEKPSWAFIRRSSRKMRSTSGSETSSPRHGTPDASPPQTPSLGTTQQLESLDSLVAGSSAKPAAQQTPATSAGAPTSTARRFWRATSSHGNQATAVPSAGPDGGRAGFHLPTLSSVRSAVARESVPAGTTPGVVQRDDDSAMDELRLEVDSLRLLSHALDAVDAAREVST